MASTKTKTDFTTLPKTELFTVNPEGVRKYYGPSDIKKDEKSLFLPELNDSFKTDVNPNGGGFLVMTKFNNLGACVVEAGVTLIDLATGAVKQVLPNTKNVQYVMFSPKGTYLMTWEKQAKVTKGQTPPPNFHVINLATGARVSSFMYKNFTRESWPKLKFSDNETIAAMMVTNNVHFFDCTEWAKGIVASEEFSTPKPVNKLHLDKISAFSLSPGDSFNIAAFSGGKGGSTGKITVYNYPSLSKAVTTCSILMKVDNVEFRWSSNGTMVLAIASSDLDRSGKSYYGETFLQLIHVDGSVNDRVNLSKDGAIHDVQWDPLNQGFIVVAGSMPPKATLFNVSGVPIYELGEKPRNTISWSPHGRFVVIAGFGNLAGEMDFWDRNKLKGGKGLMASKLAHCATTYEWSADSRFFMVGTTTPRMREGNGFQVFKYNGPLIFHEKIKDLSFVTWKPVHDTIYPDRPQSPAKKGKDIALPVVEEPKKESGGAWRPRHVTGRLAAKMRAAREGTTSTKATKVVYNNQIPGMSSSRNTGPTLPVGAPPTSTASAAGTKKKRNRKKKTSADTTTSESKAAAAAVASPAGHTPVVDEEAVKAKKVKKLNKTLKQIDELKEKMASGTPLNEDQKKKITTESEVKKELESFM